MESGMKSAEHNDRRKLIVEIKTNKQKKECGSLNDIEKQLLLLVSELEVREF